MDARPTVIVLLIFGVVTILALVGPGCGSGDRPLEDVDPAAAPLVPTYDQVAVIVARACTPCHDDEDDDGGFEDDGRPRVLSGAEPALVTCEDIVEEAGNILDETVRLNTMPPGAWPRLTSREKLILERWVEQGACTNAPCTTCE